MTVVVRYFDIHAEWATCCRATTCLHYPITGGIFDGCVACFTPPGAPSVGRVYNIGSDLRYVARARPAAHGGGIALWDVTP